jgi:hypothetical protein
MNGEPQDQEKLAAAKAHVEAIKGFYIHAIVFISVMTALILADYANPDGWWVQWPLIGWGIGILAHAYMVFGSTPQRIQNWEKRKIDETIAKM